MTVPCTAAFHGPFLHQEPCKQANRNIGFGMWISCRTTIVWPISSIYLHSIFGRNSDWPEIPVTFSFALFVERRELSSGWKLQTFRGIEATELKQFVFCHAHYNSTLWKNTTMGNYALCTNILLFRVLTVHIRHTSFTLISFWSPFWPLPSNNVITSLIPNFSCSLWRECSEALLWTL